MYSPWKKNRTDAVEAPPLAVHREQLAHRKRALDLDVQLTVVALSNLDNVRDDTRAACLQGETAVNSQSDLRKKLQTSRHISVGR